MCYSLWLNMRQKVLPQDIKFDRTILQHYCMRYGTKRKENHNKAEPIFSYIYIYIFRPRRIYI